MIHQLEIDSVFLEYGNRKILSGAYLKCETGKVTGLLGRNGNGKTTLMNIIYGTLKANNKFCRIDELYISHPYRHPHLIRYLPQSGFIPKNLSLKRVFEDFQLDYSALENLFPEFKSHYHTKLNQLSGGQRRLAEIFTVLKSPSKFVLLDEPFSYLSPLYVELVQELIVTEKANKGVLVTDHMFREIVAICDDLYLLSNGTTRIIHDIAELEFMGYAKY